MDKCLSCKTIDLLYKIRHYIDKINHLFLAFLNLVLKQGGKGNLTVIFNGSKVFLTDSYNLNK